VEIIPAQVKIQDQVPQKEATTERPASGSKSKKKYFLIGLVVLLFISLTSIATYWYFVMSRPADTSSEPKSATNQPTKTQESKLLRLSSKPLDEPSYLVYTVQELLELSDEQAGHKSEVRLMVVKENGTEKKELLNYVFDMLEDPVYPESSFFQTYGKDNILAETSSQGTGDTYLRLFNRQGDNTKALSPYEEYNLPAIPPQTVLVPAVSADNTLLAVHKNPVFSDEDKEIENETTKVLVVNLKTAEEKTFDLPGKYNAYRPILHFSPNNKKLYACICSNYHDFYEGPARDTFEIDIASGKVTNLNYITKLRLGYLIYRYDSNTAYGNPILSEFLGPPSIDQPNKIYYSNKLLRINLDTQKHDEISFKKKFLGFDISPRGTYAAFFSNASDVGETHIKNLKTGEEWNIDKNATSWKHGVFWSDSEKLATIINSKSEMSLYIYNPKDKSKILVEKFASENNYIDKVGNKRLEDIVGWIH